MENDRGRRYEEVGGCTTCLARARSTCSQGSSTCSYAICYTLINFFHGKLFDGGVSLLLLLATTILGGPASEFVGGIIP